MNGGEYRRSLGLWLNSADNVSWRVRYPAAGLKVLTCAARTAARTFCMALAGFNGLEVVVFGVEVLGSSQ